MLATSVLTLVSRLVYALLTYSRATML